MAAYSNCGFNINQTEGVREGIGYLALITCSAVRLLIGEACKIQHRAAASVSLEPKEEILFFFCDVMADDRRGLRQTEPVMCFLRKQPPVVKSAEVLVASPRALLWII